MGNLYCTTEPPNELWTSKSNWHARTNLKKRQTQRIACRMSSTDLSFNCNHDDCSNVEKGKKIGNHHDILDFPFLIPQSRRLIWAMRYDRTTVSFIASFLCDNFQSKFVNISIHKYRFCCAICTYILFVFHFYQWNFLFACSVNRWLSIVFE